MLSLLKWDVPLTQHICIVICNLSSIREEYIETLDLCEHGSSYAALCSTEYYNA